MKSLKNITYGNLYQEKWETRSSVRTRPRKVIDFNQNGYFFPENKQPLLLNEEVINLGERVKEKILLLSFYKYLNDIVNLEIELISSVCNRIIYRDLIVKYTDLIKLNACTVIIDEYYHMYLAQDIVLQLKQQFTNLQESNPHSSDASNAVKLIKNQLDKKYHDVFEIIAVCIFETTVVRELVEFFNNDKVHPSIRYYVNDHMNDEAKHYGFFYDLLYYTWQSLSYEYKENIGRHLANFTKLYLNVESEKSFNFDILVSLFKDQGKAETIINDLYKGFDITPEIPIVKNVLNVLQKTGMLDDTNIRLGFKNIGWSL
jgi:hypothetical protein